MSNDVTLTGKGITVAPLPPVSPEVRKILDTTVSTNAFGGDAGEDGGPGPWRQPKWLPEPLRAEAEKVLPRYDLWASPATPTFMRDFLVLLFNATRHNADQDWDVIGHTYPVMLSGWPAWCFHPDFLPETGQHFTWFPSVAELADWLRPRRLQIENDAWRLRFLSRLPNQPKAKREVPPPEGPWQRPTPEQKTQATENLRPCRERPPTPFAASLRPEDDSKVGFRTVGDAARQHLRARRDPVFAQFLEENRRYAMARAEADRRGRAASWDRFVVPIDQPLEGDLRALYGHPCPGHEQSAQVAPKADNPEIMV